MNDHAFAMTFMRVGANDSVNFYNFVAKRRGRAVLFLGGSADLQVIHTWQIKNSKNCAGVQAAAAR